MSPQADKRVLLISPLPPPASGIASWTQRIMTAGLPGGYTPEVLNTRVIGRTIGTRPRWPGTELYRSVRILGGLLLRLALQRPRIVHLNCSLSRRGVFRDLLCAWLIRLFRLPLVTHYRGDISDFRRPDRRDRSYQALRRLIHLSHGNIAVNRASLDELIAAVRTGQMPPVLIPNFVLEVSLAPGAGEGEPGNGRNGDSRVLFAGTISVPKGCGDLIEVARALPEVEFQVMGAPAEGFEPFLSRASPNLRVTTGSDQEAVLAEMRRSSLLLFPSHSEGFPNVVVEAMSVGLPVVASRVGAIPEMIEDQRGGILVEKGDTGGMARAIRRLLSDPELRRSMAEFSRHKCEREYRYETVVLQLISLYTRVLEGTSH